MDVMSMNNVAYIGVYELNGSGFAGGLLVCDRRGLPVDFRYVEPIKPTKLQRLIYGAALKRYLMVEAIGAGLLKECRTGYDIAFVDDTLLLELKTQSKAPIAKLSRTELPPLKELGEWEKNGGNIFTYQTSNSGAPVQLEFCDMDNQTTSELLKQLAELSATLDIAEPLERVRKAVAEVGTEDNA